MSLRIAAPITCASFLWGERHNYDSEGDCSYPADRNWTELILDSRERENERVDVDRVCVHPATVRRALQRLGLPRKKSLEAAERDEQQRAEFRREAAAINRRRLVFTDETGFHLAMTRSHGRAPRGQRVRQRVPRKRGTNVTLIGALALRGWVAALSFSGSVDGEAFDAFVTELLAPRLRRSDVLLLERPARASRQRRGRCGARG